MRLPTSDPGELRILHAGGYWRGPNDMVRQMMLGLRAAGADVLEFCTDEHPEALDTEDRPYDRGTTGPVWLRWEGLRPYIEQTGPHLIVCNAGGLSFRPADAERLRESCTLLGIALSDPDVFRPTTHLIAPNFDLFLTNAPELVPGYRALGARAESLTFATNEEFFRPVPPRPELGCDVLVLGRAHPDRVEAVRTLFGVFDVHLYGEGWEPFGLESRGLIFGDDVLAALASAAVTVVFFRTGGGYRLVKPSLFDFAAAGALVATNRFSEVDKYLEFGREIVGFESTEDLVEKVCYCLEHPDAAMAIRQAGRARVVRDHTWKRVWPRVLASLAGEEP
jgi:spore maturation protein CgeB